MTAEPNTTDSPLEYSADWSDTDKVDYIAFHLRAQTMVLAEMREEQAAFFSDVMARINAIGQKTTDIDAFCREVRSAIEGMRRNPLMRGMLPNLPPPPGGPPGGLIH